MATNQVYDEARHFSFSVPAGVLSGNPVMIGDLPGVALTDRRADGTASVDTGGAYMHTVTGAVDVAGRAIYAIVAAGLVTGLTTTASGNTFYGYALASQAATGQLPVKTGR